MNGYRTALVICASPEATYAAITQPRLWWGEAVDITKAVVEAYNVQSGVPAPPQPAGGAAAKPAAPKAPGVGTTAPKPTTPKATEPPK